MTREWHKPDRRIGVSLDVDGLTWWYVQLDRDSVPHLIKWVKFQDSGHVFGDWRRLWAAVRMYWSKP